MYNLSVSSVKPVHWSWSADSANKDKMYLTLYILLFYTEKRMKA